MSNLPPLNTTLLNEDNILPPHIEIPPTFDTTDSVLQALSSGELTILIPESHPLYPEAERSLSKRYKRNFAALKQWLDPNGVKMELEYSYAVYMDEFGLRLRLFATSKEYVMEERVPLDESTFFDASHVVIVEAGEGEDDDTPTQAHWGNSLPIGWI